MDLHEVLRRQPGPRWPAQRARANLRAVRSIGIHYVRRTFMNVGIHNRRTFSSRNTLSPCVQSVLAAGSVRGSQPGQLCTGARATGSCKTTWGQISQYPNLGVKYLDHLEANISTLNRGLQLGTASTSVTLDRIAYNWTVGLAFLQLFPAIRPW